VLSVRARNFNDAQTNLKKAIELDPSYAPAYRELADMYYYANQPKLAVEYIKKYVGLAEPSPATNSQYAAFLYLSKEYADALTEVNKVLAADPNNLTMNRLKAYLSYETKDYPSAAAAMENYMKIAPANKIIPEDYVYDSKILIATGRAAEGIAKLEKFIQSNPDKACDLQNDLANAYTSVKDCAGAVRAYKKKLTNCNGDLADQFRLASAFNCNKQYTQADSTFNIILTAKPTYSPGYLARARTNMSMDPEGKKGLAKPYYDKYIELSQAPDADASKFREGLVEAYGYLGVYNFQAGKKPEAIQNFEKVLELDPGNQGATNNIKILKAPTKTTTTKKTTTTTKKK
jgi:tetratricopeptide (TPR) repeat protein